VTVDRFGALGPHLGAQPKTDGAAESLFAGSNACSARERMAGSMISMSDHGESLGEHGLYARRISWLGREAKARIEPSCVVAKSVEPQSHDNGTRR
jgi:hypothetical protein